MGPDHLADWCMMQPGYLRHDKSARDMASLIRAHGIGDFDGTTGKEPKMIWHVGRKMEVKCYTPLFAFDLTGKRVPIVELDDKGMPTGPTEWEYWRPGCHFWKLAATRLDAFAKTLPRKNGFPAHASLNVDMSQKAGPSSLGKIDYLGPHTPPSSVTYIEDLGFN